MKYMGSKARFVKYIKPIIEGYLTDESIYIEPFVGGGNLISEIACKIKIGYDYDENVISALNLIKNNINLIPKNNTMFTETEYKIIKNSTDNILRGYVGFALSYGGKWFGGWCRDSENKRDYVSESYRNAVKQNKKIQNCLFDTKSYLDVSIPRNSVVYCDPPYKNTTNYPSKFDHDTFYGWAREVSKTNIVLISEYTMPEDFVCIWEKETTSSLTKDTGSKKAIERLFIHKINFNINN